MLLLLQRFLAVAALAMLSCAQVFGVLEGYLCGHDGSVGVVQVTQVTHCHEDGPLYVPCEEPPAGVAAADCADLPGAEKHAQVATHLTLSPSQNAAVAAPAVSLPLLLVLPPLEPLLREGGKAAALLRSWHIANDAPPSVARQVAGCMILLV